MYAMMETKQATDEFNADECSRRTVLCDNNVEAVSSDSTSTSTSAVVTSDNSTPALNTISVFFQEQGDLVSEILSFLDVQSLLAMCTTTKKTVSWLRYEHVFSSTFRKRSDEPLRRITDRNAIIILNKLARVYDLKETGGIKESASRTKKTTATATSTTSVAVVVGAAPIATQWRNSTKPSPLRLLKLVNGRKCERCHCDLVSPCVWAGNGSSGLFGQGVSVLPSLSFGEFCCTLCIFDATRLLASSRQYQQKHHQQPPSNRNGISNSVLLSSKIHSAKIADATNFSGNTKGACLAATMSPFDF